MEPNRFLMPEDWCRGTDFWMLNDTLEEPELRRQLRSMHQQGIRCVIARTYMGLKSDYPGPDWMSKMHAVVEEAKALGMKLFMQAGYMPEAVLDLPEKFSLMNLRPFPKGKGEGELLCTRGELEYRLVYSKTILDMLSPEAMEFYIWQSYENMWKDFKDEFGKTIISMWVDEPSYAHVSIPWTRDLPKEFEKMWGMPFPAENAWMLFEGGEESFALRHKFWRVVLKLIQSSYFAGVRDWCHANGLMFSGHLMTEDTLQSQIRATCFTMPLYRYFDLPGTDHLTAHQEWQRGEIKEHQPWGNGYDYSEHLTPLQCTSAAHQADKNVILCEMYGVSTENMGFRDQRGMFDMFASQGINHRSVHALFYSLRGRGKRCYPPHVNSYQPYWPEYHRLVDTVARESAFLRAGKPVREVLLLHPIDTAFGLYRGYNPDGPGPDHTDIIRESRRLYELIQAMTGWQCPYELGDEECMEDMAKVENGRLHIGAMSYSTVVLSHLATLRPTTLRLLKEFALAGGRILVLGDLPARMNGDLCPALAAELSALPGLQLLSCHRELKEALDTVAAPYRILPLAPCARLQHQYREDGEQKLFFLHNNDYREECLAQLRLPGHVSLTRWEPETGEAQPYPCTWEGEETVAEMEFAPGSTLLLTAQPAAALPEIPAEPAWRLLPPIRNWALTRQDPNTLLLERFRFARGEDPLSEKCYPILTLFERLTREDYHGDLTLTCTFENRMPLSGAKLVCENPLDQTFFLDGAPLSNQPEGWWRTFAFETLPLPTLEPGVHTITVKRWFQPLKKPVNCVTSLFENLPGVELEQMMLIGDFAVTSAVEPSTRGVVALEPDFILTPETGRCSGELSSCGYPFYTGAAVLSAVVTLTEEQVKSGVSLVLEDLLAPVATVSCNGEEEGAFTWAPYRVELTHAKAGENLVEIRVFSSIRNLLGPWHRVKGELGEAWGGYEYPNLPWLGVVRDGRTVLGWEEDREPEHSSWTERYLALPLGVVHAQIMVKCDR